MCRRLPCAGIPNGIRKRKTSIPRQSAQPILSLNNVSSSPVIEVQDLCKRFGQVNAVDGIDFTVARGSITGLLGGNGAGKTTTIAMLLGLLLPTRGNIRVLGEDMLRHRYRVLARLNFTSPYVDLPGRLSVIENLNVYGRLYGVPARRQRIAELAAELDFTELLRRPYRTLSAGQKTRVAIAKALLNRPEVLFLDEPTASLDPDTADRMRHYLLDYRQRNATTLFMASHNMAEVERMCDQVILMREGRIVDQGSPTELIARYGQADLEAVFLTVARNGREATRA